MKYYIPSSSLNLDAFLQSESISPAPYYPIRNNGFRSIELIDQVRSFENIIMFSYPVRFVRTDMNRYNFPILIEFEDDVQLKDIQTINDGIFACNHTLFLTPSNCNIYFFSKLDYDRTLINTKDAVYIKYFKDFKIYPTTSSLKMETFPEIPSTASLLQLLPSKENTVDRTKGALYGYMLGIRLSITPELAHLNNLSQQIYDAITGALLEPNNSNKYLPQITSLLNQYKEIDPIEKESADTFKKKLLDQIGTKFALGVVIDILDMLNLSDNLKISWGLSSIYQTEDLKLLRDNIEKRTTLILRRNYSLNPISVDNVTVSDDSVNFTNAPLISEAIKWINTNNISQESLTRDKLSICAALGKIAKSVKGDIPDIQGMRDLYESIQYVQPFALHNIVDNEIRALSAFIYKGNSISGYLKYLRTKEITDYSLYLLLWGATVGYNEMDKNILSPILSPDVNKLVFDKMQLNNMYPCIPHSVYDLPEDLPECISNDADITSHTHNVEESNVVQNTDKNENDINCEKNNTAITEETYKPEVNDQEFDTFWSKLIKACKGVIADRDIYFRLFKKHGFTNEFLNAVSNDSTLNNGKSIQATAKKCIERQVKAKERQQEKESTQKVSRQSSRGKKASSSNMSDQPSLFDQVESSVGDKEYLHFRSDYRYPLIEVIKAVNPNLKQKLFESILDDLTWVLDPKYIGTKTELDLIKDFEDRLIKCKTETISRNNKDMSWKIDLYAPIDVAQTISAIKNACGL